MKYNHTTLIPGEQPNTSEFAWVPTLLDNSLLARAAIDTDEIAPVRFEDPKVDQRWTQLRQFGLDLPGKDLSVDLDANKRILLQRGMHLRQVIPAPDMGDGVVQFIAATEGIKRDGNMLLNSGWKFDNFAKNPVFLFQHDYSQLPIGKHLAWQVDSDGGKPVLRIWSRFVSADIYPFAERVRMMYEKGFLRAVSIGWIPLKYSAVKNEEDIQTGWLFEENELLEVSAVSVPADPDAIIQGINQRILEPSDIEQMATYVDSIRAYRNIVHVVSNIDSAISARAEVESDPEVKLELVADEPVVEVVVEPAAVDEAAVETPVEAVVEAATETVGGVEEASNESNYRLNAEDSVVHSFPEWTSTLTGMRDLLTSGNHAFGGEPYSAAREDRHRELVATYESAGRKAPTFDEVETVYQVSRQLYSRGLAHLDKYEAATDAELIEGLLYVGASYPDELADILGQVRDAVDRLHDTTRDFSLAVERVGSKISKDTRKSLMECDYCLEQARTHLKKLMTAADNLDDYGENDHASAIIGVDVSRYGSDETIHVRRGLKSLDMVGESQTSAPHVEGRVVGDDFILNDRIKKVRRTFTGEPEPVSVDDVLARVTRMKASLAEEVVADVSRTSRSEYIRSLLQKIIDSQS